MKLNFGSGGSKREGWINADIKGGDINFDFNKFPYCLIEDNTFDYIYSKSTIEHLDNLEKVFNELHRISKDKAVIEIVSPFWLNPISCGVDHKHIISADWIRPIIDNSEGNGIRYRIIKGKFDLIKYEYVPSFKVPMFIVNKFANVIPCLVRHIKHYLLVKK